jgi:hypothetical protein
MWAQATKEPIIHVWQHIAGKLIAVCGEVGELPIDYTARLPRCEKCVSLLPKYKEKKV